MNRQTCPRIGRPARGWEAKARFATDLAIAAARALGSGDRDAVRREVIGHAREALGEAPGSGMARRVEPGPGRPVVVALTPPGMFRLALEGSALRYREPMAAESFMAIVIGRLDEVLGRPEGPARVGPGPAAHE